MPKKLSDPSITINTDPQDTDRMYLIKDLGGGTFEPDSIEFGTLRMVFGGGSPGGGGFPGGSSGQIQWKDGSSFGGFGSTDGNALNFAFANPTLSGDATYRYGIQLTTSFDSSAVEPLFCNQTGMANILTSLNGQSQYGGGTNAKQSFINHQNFHTAYASGQHFNSTDVIYAFGIGDTFTESKYIYTMGGMSAQGDEGTAFLTSGLVHYPGVITASITSVPSPATINTTTTQSITKALTPQTVTVSSSAGVSAGQWVVLDYLDTANYNSNIEAVKVTSVGAGTITGIFRANHANGTAVKPAVVIVIDSPYGFGQGRALINLTTSAYTTGTASPQAAFDTAINGAGGASWTSSMVGGDAHLPGYLAFTDDDQDLTNYGSATTLKAWYPITSVDSTTLLQISRTGILGESGYPGNGRAFGGSSYTIRAGARILMFDGDTSHLVLETNTFTWTAGHTVECAFSTASAWTGAFYRFTPLMPGSYDGLRVLTNGPFRGGTGLSVYADSPGVWDIGGSISGITALELVGNPHAIKIGFDGTLYGDIYWEEGSGVSMGRNNYLGDQSLVISTLANVVNGGHPAYENNIETRDGVFSLWNASGVGHLRWNGLSYFTSNIQIGSTLPMYLNSAFCFLGLNLYRDGSDWKLGAGSSGDYGGLYGYEPSSGGHKWYTTTTTGDDGDVKSVTQILSLSRAGVLGFGILADATIPALKPAGAVLAVRLGDDSAASALTVADEAYGAGWDGSLEVPTKNALYDKIETLAGGGIAGSTGSVDNAILRANGTGGSTAQASVPIIEDIGTLTVAIDTASADAYVDRIIAATTNSDEYIKMSFYEGSSDVNYPTLIFGYSSANGNPFGGFVSRLDGTAQWLVGMGNTGLYGGAAGNATGRFIGYYDSAGGGVWRYGFNASGELFVGPDNSSYGVKLAPGAASDFPYGLTVADDAYAAGWDGSLAVPTKNAIYDKVQTLLVQNGVNFGPSAVTSITVANGQITAIS